jgi:hypothetical protein
VTRAEALTSRADTIAASLSSSPLNINLEDIDVVCSGGGNYDAFYMGVHMILDRVAANKGWNIHRHAGVSAGGMMPMEIALKSESTTLKSHLSYGVLSAQFADKCVRERKTRADAAGGPLQRSAKEELRHTRSEVEGEARRAPQGRCQAAQKESSPWSSPCCAPWSSPFCARH